MKIASDMPAAAVQGEALPPGPALATLFPASIPSNEEALRSSSSLALWWHLARCYHALAQRLGRFFEEQGITGAQFGVLRCVGEAGPEGLRLTALSERLMVTCGNITGVVDRLELSGLLRRERSLADRRVIMARLTPRGADVYRLVVPRYRSFVIDLLSGMSEIDRHQLAELCEQLNRTLGRAPAPAATCRQAVEAGQDGTT
jgi:DNA-binding MarR family transcriptional regulator